MGFSNLSKKKLRCILDFKFWDAPSLTFPTHLGNNKSLVFIWAWSPICISETVVMQISQLFMFQTTHTWFIVAQVMSFGEWLSIIARSELGSDLDCSVINARSELSSDLDCYELTLGHRLWRWLSINPTLGDRFMLAHGDLFTKLRTRLHVLSWLLYVATSNNATIRVHSWASVADSVPTSKRLEYGVFA